MRRALTAIGMSMIGVVAVSMTAHAGDRKNPLASVEALYHACELSKVSAFQRLNKKQHTDAITCLAYVRGVTLGLLYAEKVHKETCIHHYFATANTGKLVDVFLGYVNRQRSTGPGQKNLADRKEVPGIVIIDALKEAYPCK